MSGVQRNTFLAVLLATTISTLLACSTLSADVKVLRNQANAGDVEAQCQLGVMYANGSGVPKDFVQSYFWLSLASSRTSGDANERASEARDLAGNKLPPDKLLEAQRMITAWEKLHLLK
jgi:TPR repeat protein